MARTDGDDQPLKRLGAGRWATRDERFTIEPQSGTWVIVDAEQTDELGLPLVRGPFASLREAKAAIAEARAHGPVESPLSGHPSRDRSTAARPPQQPATPAKRSAGRGRAAPPSQQAPMTSKPDVERTPRWIADLAPNARRRARRMIDRLSEAGVADAEGMVRRDIVGDVPTVAAFAVVRALAALGPDGSPAAVARLLIDGRDEDLDVRWRLVDGDARQIRPDLDDREEH
jgi:hypothetical protein